MITPVLPPQKIMKVGNSLAVTLPNQFVRRHHLKAGKSVFPRSLDGEIKFAVKQPRSTEYQEIGDREFVKLMKDVELRYGNVLQKLANLP